MFLINNLRKLIMIMLLISSCIDHSTGKTYECLKEDDTVEVCEKSVSGDGCWINPKGSGKGYGGGCKRCGQKKGQPDGPGGVWCSPHIPCCGCNPSAMGPLCNDLRDDKIKIKVCSEPEGYFKKEVVPANFCDGIETVTTPSTGISTTTKGTDTGSGTSPGTGTGKGPDKSAGGGTKLIENFGLMAVAIVLVISGHLFPK